MHFTQPVWTSLYCHKRNRLPLGHSSHSTKELLQVTCVSTLSILPLTKHDFPLKITMQWFYFDSNSYLHWHLIISLSASDFLVEIGLNLALDLITSCCHSSVDSSAPSILPPRVRIPSTQSMLFSSYIWIVTCRKDENKQKEAEIGPFKKQVFV